MNLLLCILFLKQKSICEKSAKTNLPWNLLIKVGFRKMATRLLERAIEENRAEEAAKLAKSLPPNELNSTVS